MKCELIVSTEFVSWLGTLSESARKHVQRNLEILEAQGTSLGFPYSSAIKNSRYAMREIRVKHTGAQYRILYVFDPKRNAFIALGGDKVGDNRWYEKMIRKAEHIYERHLEALI